MSMNIENHSTVEQDELPLTIIVEQITAHF